MGWFFSTKKINKQLFIIIFLLYSTILSKSKKKQNEYIISSAKINTFTTAGLRKEKAFSDC